MKGKSTSEIRNDYQGFLERHAVKMTTDECETPEWVYETVADWVVEEYRLEGRTIVRPFWPGGDYQRVHYPEGCVVIDNPPFSILAQICAWFSARGIDFFLFAPHLTLFSVRSARAVVVGSNIEYANGAKVRTSFLTSLGAARVRNAPELWRRLRGAGPVKDRRPVLVWPRELVKSTTLDPLTRDGIDFAVGDEECEPVVFVGGRKTFGGGFLVGRQTAEQLPESHQRFNPDALHLELSEAQRSTVDRLSDGR